MDMLQVAERLIELSGTVQNITSATHCSTRLRFIIKNKALVDVDAIKATKPVLGVVFTTDELQIVLGKDIIPVYNEAARIVAEQGGKAGGEVPDDAPAAPKAPKATGGARVAEIANNIVGFVSASVTPLIPGLVSGGMLKVFLLLATLAYAPFADTNAYTLLSQLANVPFYFMPVFVAYGVSKKLGGTPLYSMSGAAAGGVVAGVPGATAYVYGYSTILALPIFQDTMFAMAVAIVVAIAVAAIVTAILGFEDEPLPVE